MKTRSRLIVLLAVVALLGTAAAFIPHPDIAVLNPAGEIARRQRDLLYVALILSAIVVLPVFALTGYISYTYRAGNKRARYTPDWAENHKLELLWWGIPCAIIFVLAVITWQTSHSLDPAKAIASDERPLTIQVIALQWKWLFLYPEQQIATVNHVVMPAGRPVDFAITADAPMNSFWIPRLGGQVYAMTGMTTHLNLIADKPGTYTGSSANISGEGFAAMHFAADARTQGDFESWVLQTRTYLRDLTFADYDALAKPSTEIDVKQYRSYDARLYDRVVQKYMDSHGQGHSINGGTH